MKNKKVILILLSTILIICIGFIITYTVAYSKYYTEKNTSSTAKVANIICEMEVQPSEANSEVINPYCTITVKNYNAEEEISDTDVSYKIEVTAKENYTLPKYYWVDSEGAIISYEEALTGAMVHTEKKTEIYKIFFINSGIEEITRSVEFNIVAIQVE